MDGTERGHRHDRVVHRLQDHLPVPGLGRDRDHRQPGGALPAGGPSGAAGPLLHRARCSRWARSCRSPSCSPNGSPTCSRGRPPYPTPRRCAPRSSARRRPCAALRGLHPAHHPGGLPSLHAPSAARAQADRGRDPGVAPAQPRRSPPPDAPTEQPRRSERAGDHHKSAGAGRGGRQRPALRSHRGREPGHRRGNGERACRLGRRRGSCRRAGARRPAGLGGAGLRGPGPHPQAGPEVDARQLRADRPHHRLRDRQGLRGRAAGRGAATPGRVRFRAKKRRAPGGREARRLGTLGAGAQARDPLRAGRRRRGDRPLELPAEQLLRRLHPGPGRGEPVAQAGQPHPAHVAADGRGPARVRHSRGRVRSWRRLRQRGRRADRPRGLPDVHRLDRGRQEGHGTRGPDAHSRGPRAGRQGPDAGAGRRGHRACRQRRRPLLDAERRADLHLG